MKKISFLVLLVFMLISLTACTSSDADKKQEVTIMLDWYPNAVHSFLYTALEKGYFLEEGLDVKIQMPAETNDPLKLVAAGKTTLALSYQPQVVMARANDIPVVSVASVVNHPLNTMMVLEDSGIKSPKDFMGKTVGFSLPVYEAIAKTAVKNAGGDLTKVNFMDIGFELMSGLSTKRVDVTSGGFKNHEKILLEKEGYELITFDPVEYGVPDYYELILVASEKTVQENKDIIGKFWNACIKGQEFVKNNPQEGIDILLANQNNQFPLNEEIEKESLAILLPLMDKFGEQTEESWQEVTNWMVEYELIEKKIEAKDAFIQ